jgi:hypothetical protein
VTVVEPPSEGEMLLEEVGPSGKGQRELYERAGMDRGNTRPLHQA